MELLGAGDESYIFANYTVIIGGILGFIANIGVLVWNAAVLKATLNRLDETVKELIEERKQMWKVIRRMLKRQDHFHFRAVRIEQKLELEELPPGEE